MSKDAQLISPEGLAIIKEYEGLRLTGYPDAKYGDKMPTIGWGHTGPDVKIGQRISKEQAEALLMADIAEAVAIVDKHVTAPLSPLQRAAVISFVFNVGPGKKGKKDGFVELKKGGQSTLLKLLNERDYDAASLEFGKWVHAGGEVLKGLVRRRNAEQELFLKGFIKEPEAPLETNVIPSGAELPAEASKSPGVQTAVVITAAGAIKEYAEGFAPLVQYSEILQYGFVGISVIGVLYAVYQTRKKG